MQEKKNEEKKELFDKDSTVTERNRDQDTRFSLILSPFRSGVCHLTSFFLSSFCTRVARNLSRDICRILTCMYVCVYFTQSRKMEDVKVYRESVAMERATSCQSFPDDLSNIRDVSCHYPSIRSILYYILYTIRLIYASISVLGAN